MYRFGFLLCPFISLEFEFENVVYTFWFTTMNQFKDYHEQVLMKHRLINVQANRILLVANKIPLVTYKVKFTLDLN